MPNSPFIRSLVDDELHDRLSRRRHGSIESQRPDAFGNSPTDTFLERTGKGLKRAGRQMFEMTGIPNVLNFGKDVVDGNYGSAAMRAPFVALDAVGLKAMRAARPQGKADGIPETFKLPDGEEVVAEPIPAIAKARENYLRSTGNQVVPTRVSEFSTGRAARIANDFTALKDDISAPGVAESYKALADETRAQYRALLDQGIRFKFMQPDGKGGYIDPYGKSPAMGYKSLRDSGALEIYPTTLDTFGTQNKAALDHPMLQPSGESFDGQPALMNDLFRAVHDAYGHFGPGNPFFRARGEDAAFQLHATMYSPEALKTAGTELRGQNSWLNYGPHGEHNRKASAADTIFADQKAGIMPEWTRTEGLAETAPTNVPFMLLGPREEER